MGLQLEDKPGSLDIAVVGLACRFPGGASNSAKFWELLYQRKSAYSEVPTSRYNASAFHHSGGDKINTLSCQGGHFLNEDVAAFDAPFFNITAHEAKAMDPTARMLLEVTYEALENAGLPIEDLAGSDTSCYVGCFTRDYHEMLMRDAETLPMYAGTGTGFSLLSNRISWFYDFRGPSMTLDTACSSSLVGLHLACQGLRMGESEVAVVSGANLILSPDLAMWLSNLNMISKDGLSRSFAEGASGYGRGEGIATVILKPLANALRDGDPVRAVIRGTGVNQDGHTTGITLPNSDAQADLIRSTYRSAGLDFSHTTYFEAHGTGTAVGDPLELAAVARTLSEIRQPGDDLFVGSVKSNIGHLEGAAGLAGVIKCILMLERGAILPNIHFDRPNRRIPFEAWKIRVPTSVLPWPPNSLRRVSVNSFGYGGTNAHAILDDASQLLAERGLRVNHHSILRDAFDRSSWYEKNIKQQRLFVFSARDEPALERMRKQYGYHLESLRAEIEFRTELEESVYLDSLSFTLSKRRSQFDWKVYVVASTVKELMDSLSASTFKSVRSSTKPRVAFVFTGQGAQWARMGLELLHYPVFRASIFDAESYLKDVLGCEWSVIEELERDEKVSNIQLAKISQPICTILQVALVDLLSSWNIKPIGVVGHSSGEIGAAYSYGALSREDAWKISYWRGRLCSELSTEAPHLRGAMMAVGLSRQAAQGYIGAFARVVVACVNSPSSVTISGDEAAVDELHEILKADGVFCRKLKVENAYHSHHMELIAERYLDRISDVHSKISVSEENLTMASSVTGKIIKHSDLGPEYWVRNLVSPVLFSDAVQALSRGTTQRRRRVRTAESAFDFLLEVGPHAALKGPLRQILQDQGIENVTYRSVVLRGENAIKTAVETAGALYIRGATLSIKDVNNVQTKPKSLIDLPSYPWNHSLRYWAESRLSKNYRFREHGRHDLLGSLALGFNELEPKWRHFLRINENPWIRDHRVHSSILYPGAGIIAMPLEAVQQIADKNKIIESIELRDVHITKAIVVPDDQLGVESFLQLRRQRTGTSGAWTGWWEFSVFTSLEGREPEENCFGLVTINYKSDDSCPWTSGKNISSEALKKEYSSSKKACTYRIEPKEFYKATEDAGLMYGPSFQGLTEIYAGKGRCCCVIAIPDTKSVMPANVESSHLIHPTTLDIIFHSLFAALGDGKLQFEKAAVPISFDSLIVSMNLPSGANAQFSGFCHAIRDGPREVVADVYMSDTAWEEPKVQIKGIRCRELPGNDTSTAPAGSMKAPIGTLLWKPDIDLLGGEMLESYIKASTSVPALINGTTLHDTARLANEIVPSGVLERSICEVIDLAAHKNPDLSILQTWGNAPELTASVLSVLGGSPTATPRFSNYILTDSDPKVVENLEATFQAWKPKMTFSTLNIEIDLQEQGFREKSFDIIIAVTDFSTDTQQHHFFRHTQRLLRNGGKFLILESTNNNLSTPREEAITQFELAPVCVLTEDDIGDSNRQATLSIATKLSTENDRDNSEIIHILQPPSQTGRFAKIADGIVSSLSNRSLSARCVPWPPDLVELKGKPLISLLELEKSMLADISPKDFDILKYLVLQSSSLLWVSMGDDPLMGAAMGYLRVLKNENFNLKLRYLLVEDRVDRALEDLANIITKVAVTSGTDREFAEVDGYLCINRWIENESMSRMISNEKATGLHEYMALGESRTGLELIIGSPEQPESFYFIVDTDSACELAADEIEIEVKAVGLNYHDTIWQVERSASPSAKEVSGIVKNVGRCCSQIRPGDRVCASGMAPYRSVFRTKECLCQHIPDDVTFEEAGSWPLTFGAAYQGLVRIARIQSGQSVLVQAAAGAVGQAAIQLAKTYGATVFVTVSTEDESVLLRKYEIPEDHILNDRDPNLAAATTALSQGGRGFDVIFNTSRTGEGLRQIWHCIAPFGVLLDVSGIDTSKNSALDMLPFQRGASFAVVNLDLIVRDNLSLMADILQGVSKTLKNHLIKSVTPLTVFTASRVSDAFGSLQRQRNSGKTVVSFSNQDQIQISPSARNPLSLDKTATYILAGGLGGLGRSLARLLVANGARHLVFLSRSGPKSPNAQALTQELAALGVAVRMYACDVANERAMQDVIAQCTIQMPPIRGLIQSAAVLNDSIYDNMTHELWRGAIRPKIHGSWLLHKLLPKDLDFFVMLSSIAGVVGNRSQANYAAGNTYQDALAHYRRKQGLPAVSVDLGLMLGIGLIAERGGFTNLRKSEAVGLNEAEFHTIVKTAITGSFGQSITPTQLVTGLPTGGILLRDGLDTPFYFDDPRFSFLKKIDLERGIEGGDGDDGASSAETSSLVSQLSQSSSLHEASRLISAALCVRLAKGLQTAPENVDAGKPLHSYGMDSLMAVEIRTWILLQIKADISLFDVLSGASIAVLATKIAAASKVVPRGPD